MTGFLRIFAVPVRGSCILKPSGTGPVRGPSKKGNRTETGPDFKALVTYTINVLRLTLRIVVGDFSHDRIVNNVTGVINKENVRRI